MIKKTRKIIPVIALGIGALILTAGAACESSGLSSGQSQDYATVVNPDIPSKMKLCGQDIDLTRTDMWERFDRELTSMAYTHGNTMLLLKRANKYFPRMAPILKANGVPMDMLYLACIESNLDQRAISPAKAAGIWQFMPSTGPNYGLEVGDEVDERYNLEKATAAACKFFRQAYNKYGNWESVMASYNGGQGRISRELADQGMDSSFDLYLVSETTRYVFRVMAAKTIMENPKAFGYNLKPEQLYQPVDYDKVEVSGPVASWPEWAGARGLTYAQLVEANPWIRAKKLTNPKGKTYTVLVPKKGQLQRENLGTQVYNKAWVE